MLVASIATISNIDSWSLGGLVVMLQIASQNVSGRRSGSTQARLASSEKTNCLLK